MASLSLSTDVCVSVMVGKVAGLSSLTTKNLVTCILALDLEAVALRLYHAPLLP